MFRKFILSLAAASLFTSCQFSPIRPAPFARPAAAVWPASAVAVAAPELAALAVQAEAPAIVPQPDSAPVQTLPAQDAVELPARPKDLEPPAALPTEGADQAGGPAAVLPGPDGATTTRVPIIEYHYSTFKMSAGVRMESAWFLEQLAWLSGNDFHTLTSEQLADFVAGRYAPPARSVVLTFDVGVSQFDDYTNVVVPALRKYHLHAIFFILASRTAESCADPTVTCWPSLKSWVDEGLISVGSHSWSHLDYRSLSPQDIYRDAASSKALIEQKTGHTVLGLCYPFDSVNPAAFDLLKSLGYAWAAGGFTQADRSAHAGAAQPYALPRYYPYSGDYYPIIGGTHGQTFDQMILGAID